MRWLGVQPFHHLQPGRRRWRPADPHATAGQGARPGRRGPASPHRPAPDGRRVRSGSGTASCSRGRRRRCPGWNAAWPESRAGCTRSAVPVRAGTCRSGRPQHGPGRRGSGNSQRRRRLHAVHCPSPPRGGRHGARGRQRAPRCRFRRRTPACQRAAQRRPRDPHTRSGWGRTCHSAGGCGPAGHRRRRHYVATRGRQWPRQAHAGTQRKIRRYHRTLQRRPAGCPVRGAAAPPGPDQEVSAAGRERVHDASGTGGADRTYRPELLRSLSFRRRSAGPGR